jgi:subtilisin-like proprotein convertase family protein
MEIVSPLGTTVKLFDRSCASTNKMLQLKYDDLGGDIVGTTTLQNVALFSISCFNGENPSGNWTFRSGRLPNDTGTLNSASITICTKYTLSAEDFQINDFVLYPNPNKGNFTVQFTQSICNSSKNIGSRSVRKEIV